MKVIDFNKLSSHQFNKNMLQQIVSGQKPEMTIQDILPLLNMNIPMEEKEVIAEMVHKWGQSAVIKRRLDELEASIHNIVVGSATSIDTLLDQASTYKKYCDSEGIQIEPAGVFILLESSQSPKHSLAKSPKIKVFVSGNSEKQGHLSYNDAIAVCQRAANILSHQFLEN
jgi:uncharacterized protein (DUF2344 family)